MNFAELIAKAQSTNRAARLNENTINEATITGILLKKARKGGKLLFIAEYLIDKSVGKGAGQHGDAARTPFAAGSPHIEGAQVGEVIDLSEDWGPGIAQSLLLAGIGITPKDISPEDMSKLFERVPRTDKDLAPNGANAARGLKVRVEMVPYTKKDGKSRFVSQYSNVPQTPEEHAANVARLEKLGIK